MLIPIAVAASALIMCLFLGVLCYRVVAKKPLINRSQVELSPKTTRVIKYAVVTIWVTATLTVALSWFWFFVMN